MLNIKEAEKRTGITSQNIRYYEKQGLLTPARNKDNSYREYSEEDIYRLKTIKLFRKLDMPVAEIRRMLQGETSLEDALQTQIRRLEADREQLAEAVAFCRGIQESQLADLDVDSCLQKMEEKEKQGGVFAQIVKDYVSVVRSEMVRTFSFMPEARCDNPGEFAEELLKYARVNNLDMVITKESLSPRFLIDGVAYKAYRTSSRYGIVIHCEMVNPEDYTPEGMEKKKYQKYRAVTVVLLPLAIFALANLYLFRMDLEPLEFLAIVLGEIALFAGNLAHDWYSYGKNFRG